MALGDAQPTSNCTACTAFTCNDGNTDVAPVLLYRPRLPSMSALVYIMLQHNPASHAFYALPLGRGICPSLEECSSWHRSTDGHVYMIRAVLWYSSDISPVDMTESSSRADGVECSQSHRHMLAPR